MTCPIPHEEESYYTQLAEQHIEYLKRPEDCPMVYCVAIHPEAAATFPNPISIWIDAVHDCIAQWDAYHHLAPIAGKRVLQLGGVGIHAVKFLLGGAAQAWLLSPVQAELKFAVALATCFGVENRLRCAEGVAEDLPFEDESFDRCYSGGCLHHMDVARAMPEIRRVLSPGGRFATVDPWRTPLFAIGTRVFGKREKDVHCRPLDTERMKPAHETFPDLRIIHHGTLSRYPLLALHKLHLPLPLWCVWRIRRLDDAVCSCVPGLRRWGSGVAVLGSIRAC